MKETRDYLKSIGMPAGDLYNLPTSEKRFEDGGQYRFEVPGIQGPGPMKALLEALALRFIASLRHKVLCGCLIARLSRCWSMPGNGMWNYC